MESSSSCWVTKMSFLLLISMIILFNAEIAQGRIILEKYKLSARLSIVKEEKSGIEVFKNKLPGGPSPGSGNALINNGGVKSSWISESTLKNKLPSGGSPGTGNAFINNGGVKSSWREVSILKNKLPSGDSPGTGH